MSSPAATGSARGAVAAFIDIDAAYRDGIQELKALERARDEALLAASHEMPLDELTSATGLSRDRALRMINRARRAAASWPFAAVADRRC
jgi:hypothetical protein